MGISVTVEAKDLEDLKTKVSELAGTLCSGVSATPEAAPANKSDDKKSEDKSEDKGGKRKRRTKAEIEADKKKAAEEKAAKKKAEKEAAAKVEESEENLSEDEDLLGNDDASDGLPNLTKDDLRSAIRMHAQANDTAKTREVLNENGYQRATDVPDDQIADFIINKLGIDAKELM